MVSFAARDVRPHPEERGCRRRFANSNVRTRVSKDEDGRVGLPSCFETHRSAIGLWKRLRSRRAAMLLSMRARGRRAFWRNEANRRFGQTKPRPFWPSGSSSRMRGPMISAGGYGSRLSPRFREGRPGRRLLGPNGAPTCGCTKSRLGQFPLFRIDINNENCNSNVFGLRGPYHPQLSPTMWHHPSSIRRVSICCNPMCRHPSP